MEQSPKRNSNNMSPRRRAMSALGPPPSPSLTINTNPSHLIPSPYPRAGRPEEPHLSLSDVPNENRRKSSPNFQTDERSIHSDSEPLYTSTISSTYQNAPRTPNMKSPTLSQSRGDVTFADSVPSSPTREKPKARQLSFFEYMKDEIVGDYFPGGQTADDPLKREEVYNFVHVPVELEKLLLFGFFICLDTFLFLFTFLPLRVVLACGKLLTTPFSAKNKLNSAQVCDLLRGFICVVCLFMLSLLDPSIVYHFIRGQATIKLYVIYNVLEIFDKLACSFGQDIFDSLYWTSVSVSSNTSKSKKLPPLIHFLVCLIYVCLHSVVLFFQVVTLNVAINSQNNALLTLLISNQFVELKGSVFKKFEKENLFQISCSDMVERFQLSIFMTIIVVQNLKDLNWEISSHFLWQHLSVVLSVLLSECFVDAIKHAFITKFNGIKPEIYQRFTSILSRELLATKRRAFTESSWAISKRIGFVPLPLACLFMRVLTQVVPKPGLVDIAFIIIVLLCVCSLKVLVRILLLGKALHEFKNPEVIYNPPQLNHVSRFDMVKGKIP